MKKYLSIALLFALTTPMAFGNADSDPTAAQETAYEQSLNEVIQSFEQSDESADLGAAFHRASCSYYVKPALCNSHPHCKWNGSCVPR